MNDNMTDISIVLDRSGSMAAVVNDTIGGFNSFLAEQQKAPGEALLTLAQFDNIYDIVHLGCDIQSVPPLDETSFVPRGMTALLDAIGRTITETGSRLSTMPEEQRPGKVIVVVITDGEENASQEFTRDRINEMIRHQTDIYNWDFVFLGANLDAVREGASMGISMNNCMSFAHSSAGAQAMFASVSESLNHYRSGDVSRKATFFTDEERVRQKQAEQ